jgi:pimeloyl-ACP methyl ester carboxylesterase
MIIIGSTPIAKAYSKLEVWALKISLPIIRLWPYNHFIKTVAKTIALQPSVQDYALKAMHQIKRKDYLVIWEAVTFAIDGKGQPNATIDVPLLLIHGDKDGTGTIKRDMPVWAKHEKQATYHLIPNASHNANQDNPAFTNQVLMAFLHENLD